MKVAIGLCLLLYAVQSKAQHIISINHSGAYYFGTSPFRFNKFLYLPSISYTHVRPYKKTGYTLFFNQCYNVYFPTTQNTYLPPLAETVNDFGNIGLNYFYKFRIKQFYIQPLICITNRLMANTKTHLYYYSFEDIVENNSDSFSIGIGYGVSFNYTLANRIVMSATTQYTHYPVSIVQPHTLMQNFGIGYQFGKNRKD